jgi:hypothetical protein
MNCQSFVPSLASLATLSLLVAGGGVFFMKGQPDRQFKAMDNWQVQPEVPHSLRNGDKTTKLAITYVVEKDKPLASPAPE